MNKPTALVFMKRGYDDIELFLKNNFDCRIFLGDWGDKFPHISSNEEGVLFPEKYWDMALSWLDWGQPVIFDWVFSWLAPWKIPKDILNCAKKGTINFHPGPPKYPGIGCYNYAIWNEDTNYGVTVHQMDEEIDAGQIIDFIEFKILKTDTIKTLKNRAMLWLKQLFYRTMIDILDNNMILYLHHVSPINEKWGEYKSRKDFQDFCEIDFKDFIYEKSYEHYDWGVNKEELEKRLRATYFKGAPDGPYIEVNGKKWRLVPEDDVK